MTEADGQPIYIWVVADKGQKMRLTSVFLADEDREALAKLSELTGEKQSECIRRAIREAMQRELARLQKKQERKRTRGAA